MKQAGQGIVEYAGALIVASLIIVSALYLNPNGMKVVYTQVIDYVTQMTIAAVPKG